MTVGQSARVGAPKLFAGVREAVGSVWIEQEVPVDYAVVLQRQAALDEGVVLFLVEVVVLKGFRPAAAGTVSTAAATSPNAIPPVYVCLIPRLRSPSPP